MFLRLAIAVVVAYALAISASTTPLTTSAQDDSVPGKPSGLSATAGDTQMRLNWSDPNDSSITGYEIWYHAQSAELVGSADNIDFGNSVAVFGDVAVVGAPEVDDGAKEDSGAVSVFARHPVTRVWESKYKLKASQTVADAQFGNSVAFDGETIVVGAPSDVGKDADNNDVTGAGAAYVFTKPNAGWDNADVNIAVSLTETAKLTASDGQDEDEFGSDAVAVHGNTIVVGAYGANGTTGAAYVFTKPDTGWATGTETAKLTASGGQQGDYFGDAVAVDGDTIVVGANGVASEKGAAYVFTKPAAGWTTDTETAKLTVSDSDADGGDFFGQSVAVDGDTIVAGADGDESKTGAAYVFTKPVNGWAASNEMAKLTASDGADDDRFGWSVAIAGDTVVVGAYGDDSSKGSAYVFAKPVAGWVDGTEAEQLTAPGDDRALNDNFGFSVSIDGNTVVIGAPNADTAYVFDVAAWDDIADSDDETTSHIVTGLTNDVAYPFWVRAVNSGGASDPSDSVSETPTAAVYAPARALNFSARQTGVGQVELTWDAHRYPLTVVAYEFTQDNGTNWTHIAGSDSGTNSHTITGLGAGDYTFAVRAVNNAGMGASSDSQSITIPDKPTAPDSFSAVAGDGHVWLGWRSPADFSISGYEYRQKEGTDAFGDWQAIPGSRSGTTFHIVTGLTNGTSYTFQVRAVNVEGESDASAGLTAVTPAAARSAPSKPTTFSAEQTGVGQVELTWDASSDPLTVAGYRFTQNGGSDWTTIPGSDHSTVSHTITGLAVGNYTLGVRAVNSVGATASDYHSVTVIALPGAPNGLAATAGDTQVGLTWSDLDDASVNKFQLLQVTESIKVISSDLASQDEFGWSVAVDDDTLVIGALGDDDTEDKSGSAYVFTRVAGGWTQAGKLTASDPKDDAGFGHGVAVHGDTIVVGAYEEDHPDPNNPNVDFGDVGAAYVFTKPATGWADMTQTARLTALNAAANDEFGSSVAVYGETIVVGAPEQGPDGDGSAYIFTKPGDAWTDSEETAELKRTSGESRFGRSVAVYGDTVVVGEPEAEVKKGRVYVFTKPADGVWNDIDLETATDAASKLTANDRGDGDFFGRSVAFDGDTIVVGAPYDDDDGDSSGSAYVFTKPASGGWVSTSTAAKLTASDRAEKDEFGYSVAVDGDTVVVGARQPSYQDGGVTIKRPGSAYLFTKPPTGWTDAAGTDKRTIYDRRGDDRFGNSVAVDGDTVLVGAVGDDSDKGSAYVFSTEWSDIPGSGAATVSHIATRLPNGAEHTFRVRAVNAAGEGGASEVEATPMAAQAAPATPENFSATQTGVGKVLLEWTASRDPQTGLNPLTVSRYRFYQGKSGSGSGTWADIHGSDSSTASHTVTGLITGDTYTFDLRAVNGDGQNDAGSQSVTPVALPAAPSGFNAVAGDTQAALGWDDPGDSSITKYQLLQFEPNKLIDDDRVQYDSFGYSVAVDGDTAVIGVYQDDHTDSGGTDVDNSGSAYVFTRDSTGRWNRAAKLTALVRAANDEFGYSVAVDGDTVVIGARQDDARNGAAYVFTKPDNGWADSNETAKFAAYNPMADDEFGISVAVDGDTILVGAHQDDRNGADAGAAYLFTRPYTGWANRKETIQLIAADGAEGDRFGISVAVDGDNAVIGANKDDDSGSAYLFTKVSGVWSQQAKITASDGVASDGFGISVAVDDGTIVVGAHQHDVGGDGNKEGAAYVFTKPANGWVDGTETDKLTVSDGEADDEFGYSVAVDGDRLVVGAHQDDDNRDDSGSVYLFSKDATGGWIQAAKLTAHDGAANDRYGYSVAVSGNSVLVGAYSDDSIDDSGAGVADTGAAYLLNISDWTDLQDNGANTVSHDVRGLTNGVKYTFRIRGVNAAGGGLASANASATPQIPNPLQPTALNAEAGDTQVTVSWSDRNDPLSTTYQLLQLPETRLTVENGAANDEFGVSVAIDGDTAVIGALGADSKDSDGNVLAADAGVVYVFVRDSQGLWKKAAKLTAIGGATGDEFGTSVAVDGDTIVVGAPGDAIDIDGNGTVETDVGSAYVFVKPTNGNGWVDATETAKLTASDDATNDKFGISVAVSGGTIAVGAPGDESDEGSAYVFAKPKNSDWATSTETAKLTAIGGATGDEFGTSVAVDGDTIVVGAPGDAIDIDGNGTVETDVGSAYVFVKPTTSNGWADWDDSVNSETAKLTASDGAENDEFGISAAVDGDTIVVGARGDDIDIDSDGMDEIDVGSAYVFVKPTTSNGWADWDDSVNSETAKLTASDGASGDEFGTSVAVDGATIVVGSWWEDEGYTGVAVTNAGGVYVFALESGVWREELDLLAYDGGPGDNFGRSVAVAGKTVLAGSPGDDSPTDSGSAYLIDLAEWADLDRGDMSVSEPNGGGRRTYSRRVTGLTNDQLYVYRVRAVNIGGKRPTGEIRHATPMSLKPGKPTGLTAAAGNRRVGLSWDPSDDSSIEGYQVLQFVMSKLTATDRAEDDEFGHSVAMDDGTAVVGAPKHDANDFTNSGAAYVFTRDDAGAWRQVAKLTALNGAADDEFGHSVAVHGDTIVVGAPQHDIGGDGNKEGAAYVFTKPANGWETATETAKLTASDGADDYEFGHSVAVHDETVVVGAPRHNSQTGMAYVFTRDDAGAWGKDKLPGTDRVETAKLIDPSGAALDRFGRSVAVHEMEVVVGAYFRDVGKGAAYVFTEPSNGWTGIIAVPTQLSAFDGVAGDYFGNAVAVDGNIIVVGANGDESGAGAAYLFTKSGGVWGNAPESGSHREETAKLTASDGEGTDYFGASVAVKGDTVVVGAYAANIDVCDTDDCDDDPRSGAAYLFTKPANVDWVNDPNEDYRTESGKLILPTGEGVDEMGDEFGNSVALDGQSIVVGAPQDDDEFGSVYVADIPRWAFLASGTETTSATVGGLTNGVEYTFQVRAVDYVGMGPGSDSVRARPRSGGGRDNRAPSFGNISNLTRAVEENTSPGALVGGPVRASDPDGDGITYSLSGFNAFSFDIVSATGQLTVKDVLDYETKSVYQVKVLASDRRNASNSVDVTINVTNVEEAGTLVVAPQQPELGVSLTATLSDPDGLISAAAWQWSRSADGSTGWSDIAGADSNSYTPVVEDVDHYLRATITYTDGHGSGKSATAITDHQVPEGQIINTAPTFGSIDSLALNIDENAPPNTLVGFPLVALDLEEDTLTYSLSGPHAALFRIEGSNGQITVGPNTTLDYEAGPVRYTVIVSVHDGRDASGDNDTAIDDYIDVHIDVNDVDEAGAVTVSLEQPKVQTALTATLSDLDGSVTAVSWQWASSTDGVDWEEIPGATSSIYTPVDADADKYVRVTAYYTDGEGVGKQEQAVLREPVRAFSAPAAATASPEPTTAAGPATMTTPAPTPMAPPTTPSDVPSAAVVPTPASDGGVPPASTPEQVADDNGIALWLILLIAAVAAVVAVGLIIVGIRIIRAPAG